MVTKASEELERMCVSSRASLLEAMKALGSCGQGIVFATDGEGRLVGTVTDGDIRSALIDGGDLEAPVAGVMANPFYSVRDEGNHRARAMELMVAHSIKQVPVLDSIGRLAGLHVIEEYIDPDPIPHWALILAGGKGTRLHPITEYIPKPMVPVAGRPILERLILSLVGAGIRRIFLSVNYMRDVIMDYFGDGSGFGCRIEYLEEDRALGTGGPLALLPETPTHPLVLMNGDLVVDLRIRDLLEHHDTSGNDITMGVGVHAYQVPFGVVHLQDESVMSIEEKPWTDWMVNHGIYAISPELLNLVERDKEFPVTDLINRTLARGGSVGAFRIEGEWHDVGRPEDLRRARGEEVAR